MSTGHRFKPHKDAAYINVFNRIQELKQMASKVLSYSPLGNTLYDMTLPPWRLELIEKLNEKRQWVVCSDNIKHFSIYTQSENLSLAVARSKVYHISAAMGETVRMMSAQNPTKLRELILEHRTYHKASIALKGIAEDMHEGIESNWFRAINSLAQLAHVFPPEHAEFWGLEDMPRVNPTPTVKRFDRLRDQCDVFRQKVLYVRRSLRSGEHSVRELALKGIPVF